MLSCQALSCWFCWTGSEQNRPNCMHRGFIRRSFTGVHPHSQPNKPLWTTHTTYRGMFSLVVPYQTTYEVPTLYKRLTKSSHYEYKCRFLFGIGYWNTHFAETPFATTAMLAPLVARYGNSTNPVSVRSHYPSEYVLCTFLCYSVREQYYVQIVCIMCSNCTILWVFSWMCTEFWLVNLLEKSTSETTGRQSRAR